MNTYWVSVRDAARLSGIPLRTVQRWTTQRLEVTWPDGLDHPMRIDLQAVFQLAETRNPQGRLPQQPTVAYRARQHGDHAPT